jgi:hypothetical protein
MNRDERVVGSWIVAKGDLAGVNSKSFKVQP